MTSAPAPKNPVRPWDHIALLALAATGGAVDAFTLFCLGKVFAGVMTGNFVLVGAAAVDGDGDVVRHAVAALAGFVAGAAAAGAAVGRLRVRDLLLVELALLAIPALAWALDTGHTESGRTLLVLAAALAMGLQAGTWGTPSTYFTGTLVAVARRAGGGQPLAAQDLWALGRLAAVVAGAAASAAVANTWSRGAGLVAFGLAAAVLCVILATSERADETDENH
ncbi:YoaK family protein [Streptodolium elevatio]